MRLKPALFGPPRWRIGLVVAAAVVALWLSVSLAVAYRLTRRSRPVFAEPAPVLAAGACESLRLKTRDGETIGAWLLPGRDDAPSVLLLHGNRGSRARCVGLAEVFGAEGCTVLMISLRAHGDSSGEFNDIGYGARHDAVAAVRYLEARRPGKPIFIHGDSLGAATAAFASEELARRVDGYILECPYQDLKTAVWNRAENHLPPVLDWVAYRGLLAVAPLVLPHLEKISTAEAVRGVPEGVPILILAGGNDRRARPEEARAIHDRVKSHARLVVFDAADHLRLRASDPGRYQREVVGFVRQVAQAGRPEAGAVR